MKKAKVLGYQPLPGRAGSPLDRMERGGGGGSDRSQPFNPASFIGRRVSAPTSADGRTRSQRVINPGKPIAPGQPGPPNRVRDRFVSLPDELPPAEEVSTGVPTIFEDLVEGSGVRGRITTYCISESIDRKELELYLRERDSSALLHSFPDVIYSRYQARGRLDEPVVWGDVFYFDYGVIVCWNLSPEDERAVVRDLVSPALVDPLPDGEVEVDEFSFHYTVSEKPHIQNDVFTSKHHI